MEIFCKRQDQLKNWSAKNLTLTPRARSLRKKEQAAEGVYEVARSFPAIWFASKQGYAIYWSITVEALSCSCST